MASVAVLENYGLLTAIPQEEARARALDVFARMYAPALGTGPTMDYLGQTGLDALKGADILRTAPERYESTVEYGDNAIARNLRAISQVLLADLGTRVFYTQHGGYDTHAAETSVHTQLWTELSDAISCFFADLRGTQGGGPGGDAGFHRVWAAGEGQRFRQATTAPAACPWSWAPRSRAASTTNSPPCASPTCWKATCTSTTTTAASTPPW